MGEVDELGDSDVAGDRDERVAVGAGQVGMVGILVGKESDHVADGKFGSLLEVFVEAHCDVVGGCLSAGPEEAVGIVE